MYTAGCLPLCMIGNCSVLQKLNSLCSIFLINAVMIFNVVKCVAILFVFDMFVYNGLCMGRRVPCRMI